MEIDILYESTWLLAVNKPAGVLVEKSPYYPSVETWAENYVAQQSKKPFVGIVHRLDRPVSGVLLLAKKKAALKDLNEQFRLRTIQKTYLALVENEPPTPSGALLHWLKKDIINKKAIIYNNAVKQSEECRLDYNIIEKKGAFYLLQITLHTGKFHQIRAQLAAIGCPIVGDEKYGAAHFYKNDAIALHANRLIFKDPLTAQPVIVEAPAPF
ncbi:MAG: RluA family pseudouridine synthase [Saprospiraceae bacterium]